MSDQPEPGSEAALNQSLACLLLEAPEFVVRDVSDSVRAFTDELRIDRDRERARAEKASLIASHCLEACDAIGLKSDTNLLPSAVRRLVEHADNLAERLALLRAVAEVTANAQSELSRALNAAKASDE